MAASSYDPNKSQIKVINKINKIVKSKGYDEVIFGSWVYFPTEGILTVIDSNKSLTLNLGMVKSMSDINKKAVLGYHVETSTSDEFKSDYGYYPKSGKGIYGIIAFS